MWNWDRNCWFFLLQEQQCCQIQSPLQVESLKQHMGMQEEMCLDVESCWALGTAELQQLLLLLPSTAGIVGKWERGLEVERNGTARASAPVCVGSCSVQVEQPAGTWWLCLGYSSAAARYPSGSSPGLGWPCSCTLQPVAVGEMEAAIHTCWRHVSPLPCGLYL